MFGKYKKGMRLLYISFLVIVLSSLLFGTLAIGYDRVSAKPQMVTASKKVFLPLLRAQSSKPVLLGVYTEGYLGEQSTIDNEVKAIDTWSGKRISIVGTFIAIEDAHPDYNIPVPLGRIWDSGYTPFVNLETSRSLSAINSGSIDTEIKRMARAFKQWHTEGTAKGQNRKAFVAPLQEMNGYWVPYHGSPGDFKVAFNRIRDLFEQEGAAPAVRWVFAPNGWSDPSDPPFEEYYPGDDIVEALAFSGYNSGYCGTAEWKNWDSPEQVYGSYIQRMRDMAPSKSIFVAQTATTAYTQYGFSEEAKNEWLLNAYNYLASSPGVAGVIYFNKEINQTCDWSFYQPNGLKYEGYREAVSGSGFTYISPAELVDHPLGP